jgi:hypothetical protein
LIIIIAAAEIIDGRFSNRFDGRLSGQHIGGCPLLTQTAVERLIETDMASSYNTPCGWVVYQIAIGVGRVTDVNALECRVFHFAAL